MLLFRSEEHIDRWAAERGLPRRAAFAPAQCWELARRLYGEVLEGQRPQSTPEEYRAFLQRVGLTDAYWTSPE